MPAKFAVVLPVTFHFLHAGGVSGEGNPACWSGGFSFELCCREGPAGNPGCWDGVFHTYATCCVGSGGVDGAGFEDLLRQGERGDASVLPRLLQMLGEPQGCHAKASVPELRCDGTSRGLTGAEWAKFFRGHANSKYMRADWPPDAGPGALLQRCCLGEDAQAVLQEMEADCALGTAALLLSSISSTERRAGREAARRQLLAARAIRSRHWGLQALDCHWAQQVNHATFEHYGWFLEADDALHFPCEEDVRVYVDEMPHAEELQEAPVSCSVRGLCFTEVWIHRYLLHSGCRAVQREDADFVLLPVYGACYGLDRPQPQHRDALRRLYESKEVAAPGERFLVALTCEKWKMEGWEGHLRNRSVVAAVESRPLMPASGASSAEGGRNFSRHCEDCFREGVDIVVPSAVAPADAARLRLFSREPQERQFIACFHGEHARTQTRSDVAEGYLEVNETVRLSVLDHLEGLPNTSIGGPSASYSFSMGNCHFCLIPRGRGWWTVRLYEAFYAGCIPVLLSDAYRVPFDSFLDWSRFSLKWPMRRVGDGLYEHLRDLVRERRPLVQALHAGVREAACWFDFHNPSSPSCSPYLGLMRELAARTERGQARRSAPVPLPKVVSDGDMGPQRFWF